MNKPDGAGVGEPKVLSEEPKPDEDDQNNAGQATPQPVDCRQDIAPQASLVIYPDVDPYSERALLWVRGALQSIGPFAERVATLQHIPNHDLITRLLLERFAALAPACLENPIPDENRGKPVSVLRYCGYKDFTD
jgi:hypothetical protein